MRRRPLLLIAILATSCDRDAPAPQGANRQAGPPPAPAPSLAPSQAPEEAVEEGGDAAAILRRYYDRIERGDYAAAWRMRGRGDEGAEAFARNFAAYERYRVTLGQASLPVEAKGWIYVEVPIQITGRLKGGKPFGSVGSVTMRRAAPGADAGEGERGWRIYTG